MDSAEFDSVYKKKTRYKFWFEDQVRFNDLDALGHVGSVRVNEYFAGVRTSLFRQAIPGWPAVARVPVLKLSVVKHEHEINFPSKLQIGLAVEKFGNSSVVLVAAIFVGDKCTALCRNVFVFINTKTRKPVTLDDKIRHGFLALAG